LQPQRPTDDDEVIQQTAASDVAILRPTVAERGGGDPGCVRERFESLSVSVVAPQRRTPEYLTDFVPREIEKWTGPIRASGAHAD
jgi:hypothetical protein